MNNPPCALENTQRLDEAKEHREKLENELSSKISALTGTIDHLTKIRSHIECPASRVDIPREINDAVNAEAEAEDHRRFLRSPSANVSINFLLVWSIVGPMDETVGYWEKGIQATEISRLLFDRVASEVTLTRSKVVLSGL